MPRPRKPLPPGRVGIVELLLPSVLRLFRKHRAPASWGEDQVRCMFHFVAYPFILKLHALTAQGISKTGREVPRKDRDVCLRCMALFCTMYSEAPHAFPRILADIQDLMRRASRTDQVAVALGTHRAELAGMTRKEQAQFIGERLLGLPVTERLVQKAARKLS